MADIGEREQVVTAVDGESESAPYSAAAATTAHVELPGPLDLAASLEMFRRAGDDGIDRFDGARLMRTLPLPDGQAVAYAATLAGTIKRPALEVTVAEPRDLPVVEAALRATFLMPPLEYDLLLAEDAVVARLEARFRGLRQVRQFDLFAALVRSISAQQVNLRWAATTRRRLAEAFGERHEVAGEWVYRLDPARLAAARVEEIRALQFTTRKAEYIIHTAQAMAEGRLALTELEPLEDAAVVERLVALRGLGRWTAEWILARTLGRPVVVAGDLAVRKAVGAAYLNEALPSEAAVRTATAHWGASAGVAQALLLAGYGAGTLST
ncbi:MAG TPA: hypothetical protein VFU88_09325 [Ktedonobacterales bacterium]|nr:hypothetical protein [Ktedonobacterales bacterium]